ncbi:lysosomal alpha-glucosidase-like isoform X2 [Centruroides vittatus]|uniref:lysosomal alpha-glucosidase-like isoform X2 n=1 Tax=Centruroides vittatus TaxID=120091 RepID=UPI00350F8623
MERERVKKLICTRWFMFLTFVVIALTGLITAVVVYEVYKHRNQFKVNCLPDVPLNYETCTERKCLWFSSDVEGEPQCFFPIGYGYKLRGRAKSTKKGKEVFLDKKEDSFSMFKNEVKFLKLTVDYETRSRVHFKIFDPDSVRYEVPIELTRSTENPSIRDYEVDFVNDPQFGIQIKRKSTGTLIFDTDTPGTVFADQFLQMTIKLPSSNIYGLGEHKTTTYKHDSNWKKWTFFARDEPPVAYNNLYGVHPFYMIVERDGNAHGVFFLNSNAMEVTIQPHPAITFRSSGGIFDFYVFMGPTPEDVVKQYLQLIGFPMFPPYWSLGFQMSKWGYGNVTYVKDIIQQTIDANIPMDVQFFDIDYMEDNRDFTYDAQRFGDLPSLVNWLHSKNMKIGIILDPAIGSGDSLLGKYPPLDDGLERDIFVKNRTGANLEAKVWPGLTYYPDFSKPQTEEYWFKHCNDFQKLVPYDCLWIDMNEPSSFVDGSVYGCEKNNLNYPPFTANVLGSKKDGRIFEKTICMDAEQHIGQHYDVHSLYGYYHSKVTYNTLTKIHEGKRPMVLTRSTFSGSGKYTAHWLGDNLSSWTHLRDSIPGILEFNLFGYPLIGADICGFEDNTTASLCARWFQLGAFYPFSRNHNGFYCIPQHPTALGNLVVKAARQAITTRYSLLPYLYTLFYYAHVEGSTVARPLLHEFPKDKNTWDINFQFLWGAALLISPAVYEKEDTVFAYFPAGVWYDFYTGKKILVETGKTIKLEASWEKVNLHVRGGYIIPLQRPRQTTYQSRKSRMKLLIAPNKVGFANGSLFWDDGESIDSLSQDKHLLIKFNFSKAKRNSELVIEVTGQYEDPSKLYYSQLIFYDQDLKPLDVKIDDDKTVPQGEWIYNDVLKVLKVNLQPNVVRLNSSHKITLIREN